MKRIEINVLTGEQKIVELTAEEVAQAETQYAQWQAEQNQIQAEEQVKIQAKQSALAKIVALGLTEEEFKTLIGK
jgi:hypothetical protein